MKMTDFRIKHGTLAKVTKTKAGIAASVILKGKKKTTKLGVTGAKNTATALSVLDQAIALNNAKPAPRKPKSVQLGLPGTAFSAAA